MSATLRVEDFTENERLFKVTPPVLKVNGRGLYLPNFPSLSFNINFLRIQRIPRL